MVREKTLAEVFSDLPDAMVSELLGQTEPVAEEIRQHVEALRASREVLRREAEQKGLICKQRNLDVPPEPSVVGIDGSYQIHRLTALDLCAAAAVAVEGTMREARRHWPEPHYRIWVRGVAHQGQPTSVLRALMVSMELELATEAPHDLILLDGSFASLIIYLNQGVTQVNQVAPRLAEPLRQKWESGSLFSSLVALLNSSRVAAVPKFTSHNELSSRGGLSTSTKTDGKTLATLILEAGEYTKPIPADHPPSRYHLPEPADNEKLNQAMENLFVVYFRPYGWTPALRLEVPRPIAYSNPHLSKLLEGIQRQFLTPAVVEPYPLFLADRMVKSLGAGISVLEHSVAQHVAGKVVDVETTMLFLQNYRTQGGRGEEQ